MSKITNDGLTQCLAWNALQLYPSGNSRRRRVNLNQDKSYHRSSVLSRRRYDLVGVDRLEQVVPGVRRRRATAGVEPDHGASRQRHGHPQRCRHVERELSSQRVVSTDRPGEHVAQLVPCYRRPVCDSINNASSSVIQRRIYYTISVQPKKDETRFEVENYDHINII